MSEVVIATYRPHEGQAAQLDELVRAHWPLLHAEGLVTERRPLVLRAKDGTILDIFEWKAGGAEQAHHNERVMGLWNRMMEIAEMTTLGSLDEAGRPFPHFVPADELTA